MRILIFTTLLAVFALLPAGSFASTGAVVGGAPEKDTVQKSSFLSAPAKGMAEIYKDYHDWQVDRGIKSALSAIDEVDGLYAMAPRGVIADSSLKLNKVYQIKSTLHTMLGMFYYRKALLVLREGGPDAEQALMDKLKKGEEVAEEDLERVADEADGGGSSRLRRDDLMARAMGEFKLASDTDPSNPSPHYQMASIYSAMPMSGNAGLAEAEYFKGAELSIMEGQRDTARGALEAIRNLNPGSAYIARIEKLLAGK